MPSEDDRRKRVYALMERYNQLGRLLPDPDNFDPADPAALTEARLVLREMETTKAELDALLGGAAA